MDGKDVNGANLFQVGECSCDECQSACEHRPGWFAPEQIAPLAANLDLTTQELFDHHLQVDWWEGDAQVNTFFILIPRLRDEEGGSMYPAEPRGACHWYVEGRCQIHAQGKPMECQAARCSLGSEQNETVHKSAGMRWNNPQAQQMIRDLYGGEPKSSVYEGIGFFGLLGW